MFEFDKIMVMVMCKREWCELVTTNPIKQKLLLTNENSFHFLVGPTHHDAMMFQLPSSFCLTVRVQDQLFKKQNNSNIRKWGSSV